MEDMAWVLYAILATQSLGLLMRLWRLNQARDYGEHDRRYARLSLSEFIAIREILDDHIKDIRVLLEDHTKRIS